MASKKKSSVKVFGRIRVKVVSEVYEVPVNLIDPAPYNPLSRSNPQDTKVKSLAKSIGGDGGKGQIVPVHLMLSKDGMRFIMEEGHRRLCAIKDVLGLPTIKAVITPYDPTSTNAAERWQVIADEVSKIDSAGRLWAYLHNPLTASKKMGEKFAKMLRLIGRPLVQRLADAGKGWDFYNGRCVRVAKFIGLSERDYRKFVEYVLDTPDAETECRWIYEAKQLDECCRKHTIMAAYIKGVAPQRADVIGNTGTQVDLRVRAA